MKYGDKIIYIEGIIVEIHDGSVGIDLKGRLGYLSVPKRMLSPQVNESYFSNLNAYQRRQAEMAAANKAKKED